ncbi:hypothetical protein ACHAWF_008658 [Thalassiosira exigua]
MIVHDHYLHQTMAGTMKTSSPAGRRLFRRHTDNEAINRNSDASLRRKKYIRQGRLVSFTRSLSRFSSFGSRRRSDASPTVSDSDVSDTALPTSLAEEEEPSQESSVSENTLIPLTVVEVDEHNEKLNERAQVKNDINEKCDGEGYESSWDQFLSNLLDGICCLPPNEPTKLHNEEEATVDDYDDITMMRIECILKQTIEEELQHKIIDNKYEVTDDTRQDEDSNQRRFSREEAAELSFMAEREAVMNGYGETVTPSEKSVQLENQALSPSPELPGILMKLPSSGWVQEPLLLTATPGSGMQIHRIRRLSEPSYFESPEPINSIMQGSLDHEGVMQLPINNGKEQPSHSWVIDFETAVFAGTALFRIRGCKHWDSKDVSPASSGKISSANDYFANQNRKFQMVMRGRFKSNSVVMADCMSGLLLDAPLATSKSYPVDCPTDLPFSSQLGSTAPTESRSDKSKRVLKRKKSSKLTNDSCPPKWALRAAVKVAGVFSPRMDANLECDHPRILSPLCSTAQTINVRRKTYGESEALDGKHSEPSPDSGYSSISDLTSKLRKSLGSGNYAQQRKSAFDAAYDSRVESLRKTSVQAKSSSPCFDPDAEYTFEFLQHLLDYNDLSLDLGKVLGKARLGGALRYQPVRFFSAAVKQRKNTAADSDLGMEDFDCLWSFDLWHRSLLP